MKHGLKTLTTVLVGAGLLSGCALLFGNPFSKMSVSPTIPAAEGTVRFAKAGNGNTSINVEVNHLANTEKLTPPTNNYVVWVLKNQNEQPQNIGALIIDKNLTGTLETITPLHSFRLFITAEGSGQVQKPTGNELLWIDYND
ncbi:MAG: hypothetical protein ACYCPQ_04590 [Elusimicrobiota bacterium]